MRNKVKGTGPLMHLPDRPEIGTGEVEKRRGPGATATPTLQLNNRRCCHAVVKHPLGRLPSKAHFSAPG